MTTFSGTISPRTEEVIAIYKEACHLRSRLDAFLQSASLPRPVVLDGGEAMNEIVGLLATLESILGESIRADTPQ